MLGAVGRLRPWHSCCPHMCVCSFTPTLSPGASSVRPLAVGGGREWSSLWYVAGLPIPNEWEPNSSQLLMGVFCWWPQRKLSKNKKHLPSIYHCKGSNSKHVRQAVSQAHLGFSCCHLPIPIPAHDILCKTQYGNREGSCSGESPWGTLGFPGAELGAQITHTKQINSCFLIKVCSLINTKGGVCF